MQKLKDDQQERLDIEKSKLVVTETGTSGSVDAKVYPPSIVFKDCAITFITLELGHTEFGELPMNGRDIRNST